MLATCPPVAPVRITLVWLARAPAAEQLQERWRGPGGAKAHRRHSGQRSGPDPAWVGQDSRGPFKLPHQLPLRKAEKCPECTGGLTRAQKGNRPQGLVKAEPPAAIRRGKYIAHELPSPPHTCTHRLFSVTILIRRRPFWMCSASWRIKNYR